MAPHMADERPPGPPVADLTAVTLIGGGGSSWVYSCTRGDQRLTLKALRRCYRGREDLLAMMRNEVEKVARLSCPLVPRHARCWEEDGVGYVLYDYIEGRTLQEELPVPPDRQAGLAADLDLLLGALEQAGLVHSDVTPTNLLVTPGGRLHLIDFGLCVDPSTEHLNRRVRRQPEFYPPELLHDRSRVRDLDRFAAERVRAALLKAP